MRAGRLEEAGTQAKQISKETTRQNKGIFPKNQQQNSREKHLDRRLTSNIDGINATSFNIY